MCIGNDLYSTLLYKAGFQSMGAGAYAGVFKLRSSSAPRIVVKVGRNMADRYLDYAKACMGELKGNKHVPVIHSLRIHSDGSYVCILEALDKVPTQVWDGEWRINFASLPPIARTPEVHDYGDHVHLVESWRGEDFAQGCRDDVSEDWRALCHWLTRHRANDCHFGNVMFRPHDGSTVITDPLS